MTSSPARSHDRLSQSSTERRSSHAPHTQTDPQRSRLERNRSHHRARLRSDFRASVRAAPDEDKLGKRDGYPVAGIGIGNKKDWYFDESVRVGSFTHRSLVSREGVDPAGFLRVARPGLQVVGYYSKPSRLELPAEKCNAYLIEEGLDAVVALRAAHNESGAVARELYSRCAKSLLLSGPESEAQGDRRLGFPLELVAERNPYTLRSEQQMPIRTSQGRMRGVAED